MSRSRARGKPRTQRKNRRPRKKARARTSARRPNPALRLTAAYMKMVADPCHSEIVRTVGSSTAGSVTERLRTTIPTPTTSWSTAAGVKTVLPAPAGYIVWFPSYHGFGIQTKSANASCFVYTAPSSSTATFVADLSTTPTNTSTDPLGTKDYETTGCFIQDPANSLLAGAGFTYSRGTTVAACLQLESLVAISGLSGQVAVVKNFNLAAFNQNSGNVASTGLSAPSISQVFSYAEERRRIDPAGHEVIWRPTDDSSIPRSVGAESFDKAYAGAPMVDTCFQGGKPGTSTTHIATTAPEGEYGICIAWRGLPIYAAGTTANEPITLNMVKIVDFELAARYGMIESVPRPPPAASISKTSAVAWYDRLFPHWQSTTVKVAHAGAVMAAGSMGGPSAAQIVDNIITMAQVGDVRPNRVGNNGRNLRIHN